MVRQTHHQRICKDSKGLRAQIQGKRILNSTPVTPAFAGVQRIADGYQLAYNEVLLDSGFLRNDGLRSPPNLECVGPVPRFGLLEWGVVFG